MNWTDYILNSTEQNFNASFSYGNRQNKCKQNVQVFVAIKV